MVTMSLVKDVILRDMQFIAPPPSRWEGKTLHMPKRFRIITRPPEKGGKTFMNKSY